MTLERDFQFPHRYEIDEVPELPGSGRSPLALHYFPRSSAGPEQDGMWLLVRPEDGDPWIGIFAEGYGSPPACSRILSLPDPNRICVVSSGAIYIVLARDPANWEELPLLPVTDVRALPEAGLVIFAGFQRLLALGRDGIAWKTPRLCDDRLTISTITSERIAGVGYDPGGSGECDLSFAVELATGRPLVPPPSHLNRPPYA
jgi:hypothetical protein